jgi:DNA adenine methylase
MPDAFFYLDPPYVGAAQGHYDGYTQEDFDILLKLLESLKGKFLLSSYRNKKVIHKV